MHVYIYDSFLSQKKYNNILSRVETRITDLGLNGKICRLGAMKSIKDMVEGEVKRGAKTIIAVGNDKTVNQVINAIAPLSPSVPFGIIPIGKDENSIAAALAIGLGEEACETISARRIEKMDLGLANSYYFLSEAKIQNKNTILEIDDYTIEITKNGEIKIINLANSEDIPANTVINPQDGILELLIQTEGRKKFLFAKGEKNDQSIFPLKKMLISNSKESLLIIDGSTAINMPVEIGIIKQKLNVIVGKERDF